MDTHMTERVKEEFSLHKRGATNPHKTQISIIVPVYKVEKYLPACIRSILRQTYRDFELILVDDGSPDRSGKICDAFAIRDKRIRVIHQENGGVSRARNTGLEAASGDWICFIDSDDEITENYLASFFAKKSCRVDFKIQGSLRNGTGSISVNTQWPQGVFAIYDFLTTCNTIPRFVWGIAYKKSIIDKYDIRFKVGVANAEDSLFTSIYLLHVQNVLTIKETGYLYRTSRQNSASKVIKDLAVYVKTLLETLGNIFTLYQQNNLVCNRPSQEEANMIKYSIINYIAGTPKELQSIISMIRRIEFLKFSSLSRRRDRLFFFILTYFPVFWVRFFLSLYRGIIRIHSKGLSEKKA